MEEIKTILAAMGGVTCFGIVLYLFDKSTIVIKKVVHETKRRKAQKNRFNKPPLAKCYCRDCEGWDSGSGICTKVIGAATPETWFCHDAVPTDSVGFRIREKYYFNKKSNTIE